MENTLEISQLLNETQTISDSYKMVSEATGEYFNIFSILQMESDEVATHSRFIAELLNRKGVHSQKDKFLSLFLKRFVCNYEFDSKSSYVFVEYHIGKVQNEKGGRIDILIKDHKGNCIMIENKIYAKEQHNQLLRYHNAFPQGKLFYLTLFGENSLQKNAPKLYVTLSYETDIVEWLEDCKKEVVGVPIVRETITQYINLLKKLTHQNLNKKMNQDIIDRVLRDKNSLSAYKTLFDLHKDLKKKIISEIVENIRKIFESKGFINIKTIDLSHDKGLLISFQTENLKRSNFKLQFGFEVGNYSGLIFGFVNSSEDQVKDPILLQMVREVYPKAKQSNWWNVYVYYEEYRDWYFAMLNKIYFDNDRLFYKDLENKVDTLLAVYELRMNLIFNVKA